MEAQPPRGRQQDDEIIRIRDRLHDMGNYCQTLKGEIELVKHRVEQVEADMKAEAEDHRKQSAAIRAVVFSAVASGAVALLSFLGNLALIFIRK